MSTHRIINNQNIKLTTEEKDAEAKFHKSRMAFAIVHDKVEITVNDERDHMQWLREDFNISTDEFKSIVRGYVKQGKIVFYKGTDFSPIDTDIINDELIHSLIDKAVETLNIDNNHFSIYNGVKVGKIGEEWLPKYEVIKFLGSYINIVE